MGQRVLKFQPKLFLAYIKLVIGLGPNLSNQDYILSKAGKHPKENKSLTLSNIGK
jgi:hypothetical protein